MSLSRKFREWATQPHAVSKVSGFTIELTKHSGTPLNNFTGNGQQIASDGGYYELNLTSTGSNPEYPDAQNQIFRFTHAPEGDHPQGGLDRNGIVGRLAHDCQFVAFEVTEQERPPCTRIAGKPMPGHHAVLLQVVYLGADGKEKQADFELGWVRKSDRDKPEWEASQESPFVLPDQAVVAATVLKDNMSVMKPLRLKKQGGYVAFA